MSHAYRVKHYIQVLATLDEAEKQVEFNRQDSTLNTVIRQDLTVGVNQSRTILKNTTDESITFGDVATAKFLYIETDLAVTMKINGGTEIFKLEPTSGAKAKLLWEGEFTAISITNASTDTDANITYLIAG